MYMVKPLYRRIPNNKCRRNEGNRNSPLEHHSNDNYRHNLEQSGENLMKSTPHHYPAPGIPEAIGV